MFSGWSLNVWPRTGSSILAIGCRWRRPLWVPKALELSHLDGKVLKNAPPARPRPTSEDAEPLCARSWRTRPERQKPQADTTLTLANFITYRCGHRGSNGRCAAPPRTRSARGPSANAPLQRSKARQGRLLVTRAGTAHAPNCPTAGSLTGPEENCSGYRVFLLTRLGWDDRNASLDRQHYETNRDGSGGFCLAWRSERGR